MKALSRSVTSDSRFFATEKIWKILLRIAPPVMLAQLIQALYNIVDSFFVGRYSGDGLTALSVVYPIQLIVSALAIGTGVGVNTLMSREYAHGREERADAAAGTGVVLALASWAVFALVSVLIMRPYVAMSAASPLAVEYGVTYGVIVCVGSLGLFLESIWSKVHQAGGNMVLPMLAQITGAAVNIVLDPLLIFGWGFIPEMGIAGAAAATVMGQTAAAVITGVRGFRRPPPRREMPQLIRRIYKFGYPSIFMQMMYTVYIMALNLILAGFSDDAVTVLGLYYKIQTFFFIPLMGMETCIVPLLSYNYACADYGRCRRIMLSSMAAAGAFMVVGVFCFELIPEVMIGLFSSDADVLEIGGTAFRIIGASFIPAVVSLMMPVFFQSIGAAGPSVLLSLTRQILCLIPVFWAFSHIGLNYTWLAFPVAEVVTGGVGLVLYRRQLGDWAQAEKAEKERDND